MNEYQQQPNESQPQEQLHEKTNAEQASGQAKKESPLSGLIEEIQRRQTDLRRLADQEGAPPEIAQALREAADRAPTEVLREAVYRYAGDTAAQRLESILRTESAQSSESASDSAQSKNTEKKPMGSGALYRMETGKMIGGVCMGIADYLRIDPSIIRLAFICVPLLFFFTPLIIAIPLLYLGMWIVLPAKEAIR